MKVRLPLAIAASTLCLLPAAPAGAGEALGNGTIEVKVQLPNDSGTYVDANADDMQEFFNRAHCLCPDEPFVAQFTLQNEQSGQSAEIVQVWTGPGCPDIQDSTNRELSCEEPKEYSDVRELRTPTDLEVPVAAIASPVARDCSPAENSASIFALVDDSNTNDNVWLENFSTDVSFDTLPPPEPHNPTAKRGENAAVLEWETPTSRQEDVEFYQVLCARADGSVNSADDFPRANPKWQTSNDLCGVEDSTISVGLPSSTGTSSGTADAGVSGVFAAGEDAMVNDAGSPDAMVNDAGTSTGGLPESLATLDPSSICGTAVGTETGIRVTGLENGVTYRIVLVSIDYARNLTAIDMGEVTPQPVTDFWEDYKDEGGTAKGGFCLINSTYGGNHPFTNAIREFRDKVLAPSAAGRVLIRSYYNYVAPLGAYVEGSLVLRIIVGILLLPVVVFAAFWVTLGIYGFPVLLALGYWWLRRRRSPARRTRRRSRLVPTFAAAATAAALIAWAPATASAQGYDPYWDHFDDQTPDLGPAKPKWVFELKLGPYMPQIDSEFSMDTGPFERFFGKDADLMGTIELDRFFAWPLGQLGVATSLGLSSRSAKTFEVDSMGNTVRSDSDETGFHLIPVSVGVVYRYTQLDDQWGIPLVPYGKAGLSYYVWWITAPDGSTAEAPTSNCPTVPSGDCTGDLGRGASLGFQLSLGLSLRAERIDKNSASALRNELGIAHAGFFFEFTYANVDGFGSSKKLNVGDLTWSAGLNFEF